jgi:hypothetical protein
MSSTIDGFFRYGGPHQLAVPGWECQF